MKLVVKFVSVHFYHIYNGAVTVCMENAGMSVSYDDSRIIDNISMTLSKKQYVTKEH